MSYVQPIPTAYFIEKGKTMEKSIARLSAMEAGGLAVPLMGVERELRNIRRMADAIGVEVEKWMNHMQRRCVHGFLVVDGCELCRHEAALEADADSYGD